MEPEKKSNGAFVGLIIIIIILIVGGIYIWQSSNKETVNNKSDQQTESVTAEDSGELDALQQESDTTDLDVGANAIDSVN